MMVKLRLSSAALAGILALFCVAATAENADAGLLRILWTDVATDQILSADPDGSNIQSLVNLPSTANPDGITVDLASGKIYWAASDNGKIQRANIDGTNVEDVVTGLSIPRGVAVDSDAGKVYWSDQVNQGIRRANLDGSNIENLVNVNSAASVTLDLTNDKMYWTLESLGRRIQRSDLDGSNVEDLIVYSPPVTPLQVALDIANGQMYFTTSGTGGQRIQRANLDGTNVQDLVTTGLISPTGLALDLSAGHIYWVDNFTQTIGRSNLDGSDVQQILTGLSNPVKIALLEATVVPEPSSIVLFGLGTLGLISSRRRRHMA